MDKLKRYIIDTPWDKWLDQEHHYLDRFCWAVLWIALLYFGGHCLAWYLGS